MSKQLRLAGLLTCALAAALAVSACGGTDSGGGSAATTAAPQAPQAPAPAAAAAQPITGADRPSTIAPLTAPPASAAAPRPSVDAMPADSTVKRLVMAVPAPGTEVNSARASMVSWQLGPMYEWAAEVDAETGQYIPMLAENWTIGEKSITFKFREGVQFHNGWGEMTAYDFVGAVEDAMHPDNTGGAQYIANIENVHALNDREAVINLKRINVTLFRNVSQFTGGFEVMSRKNLDELGEYPSLDDPAIAGTGSYQFVERSEGSYVLFKRVPYTHWRATPEFEELEFRFIGEESTRLAAILAGEAHIATLATDLHSTAFERGMARVKGTIPAKRVVMNYLCCFLNDRTKPELGFVHPDAPLTNIKLRRAISKAVNRDALNDALFLGGGEKMYVMGYSQRSDGWNPEWETRYPEVFGYDPAASRALLAEAGYNADNPYEVGMILLSSFRGLPEGQDMVLAIADMLQDVGVKVNIESMDSATQGRRGRAFEFNNHLSLNSTSSDLFTNVFIYGSQWSRTPNNFIIPRLNELHLAARATMNQQEHTAIFREVGDIMVDNNHNAPLLWIPTVLIYNPDVIAEWVFPGSLITDYSHFDSIKAAR